MEETLVTLVQKLLRKQATVEEISRLKKLFAQGDVENQLSGFYKEAWEQADFTREKEVEERIWTTLQKQIHMPAPTKRSLWRKSLRIAATLFIPLLCVGLGYYYAENKSRQGGDATTVQVEIGQKAKLQLPDGTSVWLNSAGSLTYHNNDYNKKERIVYLQGEAYFEVNKDPMCPFIVKTNDISIEALGTSFNVKAYPEDNYIAATLIEGSVRISSSVQSELLAPNERITIAKSNGQFVKSILPDAEKNIAWINNQLAFEQERLEDIVKVLERMYNVRICFASEKLKDIRFSGTIKNNNLENVLQLIEFVAPIRYAMEKDATIAIRSK
jgi:ferric-dicitrate binding protein FerR (iron transport regulator)